jgi:hypothetical protein
LFIVLSLFTIYLLALGSSMTSLVRGEGRLFERLGLSMAVGILINFSLMLTGLSITLVFVAGTILALWGVLRVFTDLRTRSATDGGVSAATAASVCGMAYILGIYYIEVLSDPDYPKLVPAIAAQLGYLKGYWNEFLPKGSLVVMLIPLALWVFSFIQRSLSFVLLVLIFFFGFGAWLWNGYMDGYVALYTGVALLLFGRYLSDRTTTDLYAGMCALGIVANLKNEGLLVAVCVVTALAVVSLALADYNVRRLIERWRLEAVFVKMLVIAIAPTVMWVVCKRAWGLQSDLAANPWEGVLRLSNRLVDGVSPQYLFYFLTVRANAIWLTVGLVTLGAMISLYQRHRLHPGALIALTTAVLYFTGIAAVYLSTPHDILPFYLLTSATRTMATASVALFISMFFLLAGFEAHATD